jgi:hypothetical protein
MRRLILAIVVLGSMTFASVALAVPIRTLKATISPSTAGTKAKPKTASLSLELITANADGTVPDPGRHDNIFIGKGVKSNGKFFPSCSSAVLNDTARGPDKCPKGSEIGSGSAQAIAAGCGKPTPTSSGIPANVTIRIFNGPGGKTIQAFLHATQPVAISQSIPTKITTASGLYGLKIVLDVPQNVIQPVPGFCAALTDVKLNIKKKTVTHKVNGKSTKVGFLQSVSCPSGKKYSFKDDVTFTNGSADSGTAEGTATSKCS